jgi:hypothetical protein
MSAKAFAAAWESGRTLDFNDAVAQSRVTLIALMKERS